MRIALEKSMGLGLNAFTLQELREPFFDPQWHFHPHYQLFVVLEGTGTRFIGDNITHFGPGDAVFLGPNLPHLWMCDPIYFAEHADLKTHGIVLYFTEDFLGETFLKKREVHKIAELLKMASLGLSFKGLAQTYMVKKMEALAQASDFDALLLFLELLHYLAKSTEFERICPLSYLNTHKVSETERMQKIHAYVLAHFDQDISLRVMAEQVGMTEPAFCRYFKKRTNRTFSDFVNEIRIGNACKLLDTKEISVTQAAYESGYKSLSNFHKQFKLISGKTPSQYRNR